MSKEVKLCKVGKKYYDEGKYHEAAIWFKKAANQGIAQAQYNLGVCYENGQGVKKDLQKAKFWIEKSGNKY